MHSHYVSAKEHKRIMAARGTMTAKAASRDFGRDETTILRVWKSEPGYEAFLRFKPNEFSARQAVLCDLLRHVGPAGMLLSDMSAKLNALGWVATEGGIQASFTAINYKLAGQKSSDRIRRISKSNEPCRYVIALVAAPAAAPEPAVEADWAPSIPSVTRRVAAAMVSVARVSFLDGASHA